MKNIKIIIVVAFILSIVMIASFYFINKNNNIDDKISETNNMSKSRTSNGDLNIQKTKGIINSYSQDIKNLYESLECPIYKAENDKDEEILINTYNYIIENNIYENQLIFQIGPIRKESETTYFIDIISFEDVDVKKALENLDDFFPTSFIKYRLIKVYIDNDNTIYKKIE